MKKITRVSLFLSLIILLGIMPLSVFAGENEPPEESGFAADPVRVEFQAEDGKNLVGYYYPSKYVNSPVVVLMHWAGGDQRDWCHIAPWLQNRLDEEPAVLAGCPEPPGPEPYWDPTWFHPMPEEKSLAVFIFDFRDFGESEAGLKSPGEWTLDAVAAYQTAAAMEAQLSGESAASIDTKVAAVNVVPSLDGEAYGMVVGGGGSIGADAVVTGCKLLNEAIGLMARCLGAYSWSPGSYNDNVYSEDVQALREMDPPIPVYCLSGELDAEAAPTCNSAGEFLEVLQIYAGTGAHGPLLIEPEYDDLALFLEFLEQTLWTEAE